MEVDEAAGAIKALVDEDADIIWGSAFVPELEGKIRVSVVATGIGAASSLAAAPTTLSDIVGTPIPARPVEAAPARPEPVAKPAATVRPVAAMPAPAPALEPIVPAAPAPTIAPVMVAPPLAARLPEPAIRLTPPAEALPGPVLEDELLLDNAKLVVLAPPTETAELPEPELVEPFEPVRGPSLFDRMAMAARAAVHVDTIDTAVPVEALRPRRRLMFGGAAR
jgi:cell division protein FtsZ